MIRLSNETGAGTRTTEAAAKRFRYLIFVSVIR
jgi:hypothetical protein